MLATFTSSALLALGACVVALNWVGVIASYRLKRQGSSRHVSLVHLVPQLFVLVAAIISSRFASPALPGWLFLLVALVDPALYSILFLPVFLLRRRLRAQI